MIFVHDEVSSSHPACQKHLRHLSTNLLRILPGWYVQKEIGHTGITLYYKVFMPYKAKRILDRLNGEKWFLPLYFLLPVPPEDTWHVSLARWNDSTERIIWEKQRQGKSSGHPNNGPTGDSGVINVTMSCKLALCLSSLETEMRTGIVP